VRFGLQARFVAIVIVVAVVAVAAAFAIRSQQQAHAGGMLMMTLAAVGLILAGIALVVWQGLVQPIRRLAAMVRRIEAGDANVPRPDSKRDDEIGQLTRAYVALNDAFVAMRSRIDHDDAASRPPQPQAAQRPLRPVATTPSPQPVTVPRPSKAGGTMVMPSTNDPAVEQARVAEMNRADLFDATGSRAAARRLRLEDDLREAWQRDEMGVVYQPIHALDDGSMRGAEALLRWQHPVDGAIAPNEFISIAEDSDLIVELGRHVLIQACADATLWPCGNTPEQTPFVSVNVSARQLLNMQLFATVVDALQRSGLAASRLHLEMPVASLRADDSAVLAMIEQLHGLGVQIWLDAVGTDAADQARWMKLPVDGVKVGRSRISGKTDDAADEASTGAIVAKAHALRIVAVVVGVEELAQLDLLRTQGAALAQGFVLCKPVDTAEIGRRLLA
jgi:EAL domain-containing protein (putative c-di-GMP-specific phosphodiesterase class I)/HAMP domain-containing protein